MQSLVVFLALVAAACGSLLPLAGHGLVGHGIGPIGHAVAAPVWGAHAPVAPILGHGAVGLGHGHVLGKRSLGHLAVAAPVIAHAIAPAAVSHQSRVDVRHGPAIVAAAPAWGAHGAVVAPWGAHSGLGVAGHGHLWKRSAGHWGLGAPVLSHAVGPVAHGVVAAPLLHAAPLVHAPALHGHGLLHG